MIRAALFHMLPSGGGIRAASQFLEGLSDRFKWTLHVPEGASEIDPSGAIPGNIYQFPCMKKLSGPRRIAAPLVLIHRLLRFRFLCNRIAEEINKTADVSLVHNSMVIAAPPVLEFLSVPSVYFCYEYPRHIYERNLIRRTGAGWSESLLAPLSMMEKKMDRTAVRCSTRIVTFSGYMRTRIKAIYGTDSVLVRPGIDSTFFSPEPVSGGRERYVMSVGALWPFKGHDLAIKSLSLLPSQIRPSIVVIGDREFPGYEAYLQAMAVSLGVDLTVSRKISDVELRNHYRKASAVLCCQHSEPYGLVPLEAMSCGCPVIAVREGGFEDNIIDGETGFLVERSPSTVSDALNRVLCEPEAVRKMTGNGRDFVTVHRSVREGAEHLATVLESSF